MMRMPFQNSLRLLALCVAVFPFLPAAGQDADKLAGKTSASLEWKREADSAALVQNGEVIWQFNFGEDQVKPSFHPVRVPGGPVLTGFRPADHPWHRGLWFSWKFVNGDNYWEEDRKTGLSQGRTEWEKVEIETRPDFSARIVMNLTYRAAEGQLVLSEHRIINITAPDRNSAYQMDWSMVFTANSNATLDRTPILGEPDGKSWGGYAGLSSRFANEMREIRAASDRESIHFEASQFRGRAMGVDYSGIIDGDEVGMTMLDHPRNPRSPTHWYAINDGKMFYLSPSLLYSGSLTLNSGQTLSLNYRVIVHPGRWTAEQVRRAAEAFASQNTK